MLPLLLAFAQQSALEPAPLLDHRSLELAIARVAAEHPALATVVPVGTSRAGRSIQALRLARGELGSGRPAILLVANVDGPLAWTSGVALENARWLAANAQADERVRAFLDTTTLYVIPRANPDAAEARFASPLREERASGPGVDDDRDGRAGEDPPADVDGDGVIAWMRVLDARGEWIEDALDPRVLVKADAKKGQAGKWKLHVESRDADRDETPGEDRELDTDVNRNFPQGWIEHGASSGAFATDEPEARALCEFVLRHRDIALVMTYGELDNLAERPKVKDDAGRRSAQPLDGVPALEADVLAEIGKRYKEIAKGSTKTDAKDAGTFQAWVQAQRGLWTLNLALWSMPLDESSSKKDGDAPADKEKDKDAASERPKDKKKGDEPALSDDGKRLRWIEAQGESARFLPWKPFEHPELGAVEIGGFAPYAKLEPLAKVRAEIAETHARFLVAVGELLPRVKLVDVRAIDLRGGLWRVEATVANDALLPVQSPTGRRTDAVRPARVRLVLEKGARLVGGLPEELVEDLGGSGARREHTWLVAASSPASIQVEVDTDHAGVVRATPEVK